MSWLTDILWSLWAGLSTLGSVLFLLLAGLALFGLFVGLPYIIQVRRQGRLANRAVDAVPQATRDQILAYGRELGDFPSPEIILAAAPALRAALSGYGIPPEELIDRLLSADAPAEE